MTLPQRLPSAERTYLADVVAILCRYLAGRLVGIYLFGSAGYGAYEPGRSDLDVQAVAADSLSGSECEELARLLSHKSLPCPARKLEFVCYAQPHINPARRHPQYEMNFNTGSRMSDWLSLDAEGEPTHWFLLDIAQGRELGTSLFGPPPASVFGPVPRRWCLEAIRDSLAWHTEHELSSANSVLNACRGWRYAVTDVFGSKRAGAEWAIQQPGCPAVVHDVLQPRDDGELPAAAVQELIEFVRAAVDDALLGSDAACSR